MNRFIRLLTLCALAPLAAHAGALQLSVLDKEGKPVPDAVVVLVPAAAGASHGPLPTRVTISQRSPATRVRLRSMRLRGR